MDSLLPKLAELYFASYWVLGVIAFLEAIPVVGTFVPGIVLVLGAGTAAASGYFSFATLAWVVSIGAFLGDVASYSIGRSSHSFLFRKSLAGEDSPLARAERFFSSYGHVSIFTSHFFGPVRAFVPLVAGLSRMRLSSFLTWAFIGSGIWGVSILGIGYIVGSTFSLPASEIARLMSIAIVTMFSVALIALATSRMVRIAKFVPTVFRSSLLWISQTGIARRSRLILPVLLWFMRRFQVHQLRGLPLTVLVVIGSGLFVSASGLMTNLLTLTTVQHFDADVTRLVQMLASSMGVAIAFAFTSLGETGSVIVISTLIVLLLLTTKNRIHDVYALVFVLASTEATVYTTKLLVERVRPEYSLLPFALSTYAFPSGHAAIAVALYGYIATLFLRKHTSSKHKTIALSIAFLFILGIGGSRILLGVHYPSDVLVGYIIGALWLAFTLSLELYFASKKSLTQTTLPSQPE